MPYKNQTNNLTQAGETQGLRVDDLHFWQTFFNHKAHQGNTKNTKKSDQYEE
jgi:hypothetical protein